MSISQVVVFQLQTGVVSQALQQGHKQLLRCTTMIAEYVDVHIGLRYAAIGSLKAFDASIVYNESEACRVFNYKASAYPTK